MSIDPYEAAKIAVGIVGIGFACAGVGHVLEKAGVEIKNAVGGDCSTTAVALRKIGGGMEAGGRGLFLTGKYTAYTVLVPAYIATYEFPKWAICKAIPKVARVVDRFVVAPVLKGAECVLSRVGKLAKAVFVHLLLPVMKTFLWKPLTYLAPKIEKVAILACKKILVPIVEVTERLVIWACNRSVEIIRVLDRFVISPVTKLVKKMGAIALKNLIIPAVNLLRFVMKECILPVVAKVVKVVSTCIVTPVVEAIRWTYEELILPVASAAHAVMAFAHKYFVEIPLRCMSQYVFKPVVRIISTSIKLLKQTVVSPVFKATAQVLNLLAKSALMPMLLVKSICKQIWEDVCLFFRVEATPLARRKMESNPGFVRRVILHPIKNAFTNIAGIFFLIYALCVFKKRRAIKA
ncbi:MAG: hypothetical protein P0S96_07425 [Simkaniaceae bacterium]|nr:hypothetical protein [Candidatus Sacchlamyda saccharinae]